MWFEVIFYFFNINNDYFELNMILNLNLEQVAPSGSPSKLWKLAKYVQTGYQQL